MKNGMPRGWAESRLGEVCSKSQYGWTCIAVNDGEIKLLCKNVKRCYHSKEDKAITTRIKEAGAILGVNVLDHIIFNNKGYYSFVENDEL